MTDTIDTLKSLASSLLWRHFKAGGDRSHIYVPGRVNLIGEHIDYYDLAVLPMAIDRGICIAYQGRADSNVRAITSYESGEFVSSLSASETIEPGSWVNYLLAAKAVSVNKWRITNGIDAAVASNLPAAAGLSSSSALLVGFTIALLRTNGIEPSVAELMAVLPEAEQFVGTRGGGMDHAAVLAGRPGCALHVGFSPVTIQPIPIPSEWRFLVAHSLTTAEKSGAMRERYNALRVAGGSALEKLNLPSYAAALKVPLPPAYDQMDETERRVFLHVSQEARRVNQAVEALQKKDFTFFGTLLTESHHSLRDQLQISNPAVDMLVETALKAGATGARMTGAGFGGCVIALCDARNVHRVRKSLVERYYAERLSKFEPSNHLFVAKPSAGALVE